MSGRERIPVAHVEDADEFDNPIAGTDRYASSVAPSSPVKEQQNIGRVRKEKTRRGSSSPITTSPHTDSDSTVHPRRDMLKKPSKDRDKSVSGSKKALMAASRPPVKHAKTTTSIPPRRDDASYYGVDPTITPATSRPRAQTSRPSSYYGPTRPPPSNARFYAQPPPPSIPPSYPPPSWMGPPPGPGPVPPQYGSPSPAPMIRQHPPHPPPSDFARPLESRFGSARPMSAMGFRPSRAIEYDDFVEEPPFDRALARRPSASRKVSKHEEDRRAMPPPPRRTSSARPTALAYRPPPSTPSRQKVNFEDLEPDLDDPLFGDSSPLAPRNYDYAAAAPFQPRPRFADLGYDGHGSYHTEVAGKNRRRNSYYGGQSGSSGSAYEDKLQQAASYQEHATGFSMPLTAETLRKAGKSGASSRSTRSSGSHDESDYRGQQSATTRTTRSTAPPPGGGPGPDEDVTIRVRGSTVLKFGNTEMQCEDGAEINITSRGGNAAAEILRGGGGGSDRSSFYGPPGPDPLLLDDRRTRVDIPVSSSQRARATSRARSRARSYSSRPFSGVYDNVAAASPLGPHPPPLGLPHYPLPPLEYDAYSSAGGGGGVGGGAFAPLPMNHPLAHHHPAPLPPPYPEYPSSYSSRHGEYFPPPI